MSFGSPLCVWYSTNLWFFYKVWLIIAQIDPVIFSSRQRREKTDKNHIKGKIMAALFFAFF